MNTDGTGFNTCKECHKTDSLWNHTTADHKEREQMEDPRNVGESSCNFGDGTDERVQSLMFMMMVMICVIIFRCTETFWSSCISAQRRESFKNHSEFSNRNSQITVTLQTLYNCLKLTISSLEKVFPKELNGPLPIRSSYCKKRESTFTFVLDSWFFVSVVFLSIYSKR